MNINRPGNIIDEKYKVIETLGSGGFGNVLKVLNNETGEEVALKYCESSEDYLRFRREVRIMKGIQHANVVQIISSNIEHDPPYFTMPIADGSLDEVKKFGSDLNEKDLINTFKDICNGVNAIHISGFTHRDIKPSNVLWIKDKFAVSDLGLAKFNERDTTILTGTDIAIVSSGYAPPEQYENMRDVSEQGDIYSLGKLLYVFLTNRDPSYVNIEWVPPQYRRIVNKSIAHNATERYKSVNDFLDALQTAFEFSSDTQDIAEEIKNRFSILIKKTESKGYDKEEILEVLLLLEKIENDEEFIELFNKIPGQLLIVYSRDFSQELEPLLKRYTNLVQYYSNEYPFSFAENVSKTMSIIFENTDSISLKEDSILSTLYASVILNRWSAMGDFDKMLKSINNDDIAYAIASRLNEEIHYYNSLYHRIPKRELHTAIQLIWDKCEKR